MDICSSPANLVYVVRARTRGEVSAHLSTRAAFVREVVADSRTHELFARLRHESRLDVVVTEWSAMLDAAAARLDLAHRSVLHREPDLYDQIPANVRRFFAECEVLRQHRSERSRTARGQTVDHFVCTVLYTTPPAIRAWLDMDLVRIFDAEVIRDIWGEPDIQMDLSAGTVATVETGQRPMHGGEHLERDARWYFRANVGVPKIHHAELAREYYDGAGQIRAPKDRRPGIRDRVDTKRVRRGIENAKRLLELTVPPEQWPQYLSK